MQKKKKKNFKTDHRYMIGLNWIFEFWIFHFFKLELNHDFHYLKNRISKIFQIRIDPIFSFEHPYLKVTHNKILIQIKLKREYNDISYIKKYSSFLIMEKHQLYILHD